MSVQGSLAMSVTHKHGSEEQKQEWLPRMCTVEAIGCFGLTEPYSGSDPGSLPTFARRDGDDWVLTGPGAVERTGEHRRVRRRLGADR